MKKKVLLGLSGGVDSAIAAHKLLEQGYDVTGAFMRNWDSLTNDDILGNPTLDEGQCTQEKDWQDAQDAANLLGLPLLRIDFIEEYFQKADLLPAIVQEAGTNEVLMLAYMNKMGFTIFPNQQTSRKTRLISSAIWMKARSRSAFGQWKTSPRSKQGKSPTNSA